MNIFARSLVLLAVAGHIGLTLDEAFARGPGGTSSGNSGGNSGSAGGHYSGSVGVNGGGHYGTVGAVGAVGVAGPNGGGGNFAPFPAPMAFGWPTPFTSFEANASACGPDLQLFDPGEFANPLDRVAAISQQTQSYVNFGGCATQDFVANALDKYADALQQIDQPAPDPQFGAPPVGIPPQHRLPREFRDLPRIIHEAATRVRKAETPHAAVKVLQAAIAFVQKRVDKTIALMRASDSDANVGVSRGADLVADTLKAAADKLTRPDSTRPGRRPTRAAVKRVTCKAKFARIRTLSVRPRRRETHEKACAVARSLRHLRPCRPLDRERLRRQQLRFV